MIITLFWKMGMVQLIQSRRERNIDQMLESKRPELFKKGAGDETGGGQDAAQEIQKAAILNHFRRI